MKKEEELRREEEKEKEGGEYSMKIKEGRRRWRREVGKH